MSSTTCYSYFYKLKAGMTLIKITTHCLMGTPDISQSKSAIKCICV
jgi:hypothetical protein